METASSQEMQEDISSLQQAEAEEKKYDIPSSQQLLTEEQKDYVPSLQQVSAGDKKYDVILPQQSRAEGMEDDVLSPQQATVDNNDVIPCDQQARALLREYFLKAIQEFSNEPCNVLTYELSTIQTTFGGWNVNGSEIFVRNLNTPAGITLTSALLRPTDVIAINFENPLKLP